MVVAVWMRARAEIRQRWRATVALALLIGLAGGFVLAAVAGARRTGSAFARFVQEHPGADVFLPNPSFGSEFGAVVLHPADVEAMPQVAAISVGRTALSQWGAGFAAADDRFGFEVPRWKIVEGRPYDPARIDEAVAFHSFAQNEGLRVGDTISYPGTAPPDAPPECRHIGDGPQIQVTIVGIAVAAGPFFAPVGEDPWSLALTPEMNRRLPSLAEGSACHFLALPTPGMMWVRTLPGMAEQFLDALEQRSGNLFVIAEPQRTYDERNADSIGLQGTALWVLAAAAAIAALLALSQTITRQVRLESEDHPALRALGLTRWQLLSASLFRVALAAAGGAVLAVAVAVALSPLSPLGTARLAEPTPGVAFDGIALGLGPVAIVALLVALALPAAWIASRPIGADPRARPSAAATAAGNLGLPAPAVAGVRLALEPGRGRTAVPVRTTIAGIALGLGMLAAALTFGASASYLLETPEAYGLTIDVWLNNDPEGFPFHEHLDAVRAHPDVTGAALGTPGAGTQIDGRFIEAFPFEPVKGDVQPRVLTGRYPAGADEILLGARTAASLGKGVGDEVLVVARTEDDDAPPSELTFTVVGIGEIPPVERAGLGEGAILSIPGTRLLYPFTGAADGLFLKFRSGADQDAVLADLKQAMGNEGLQHFGFAAPSDVVDFGRVRNLPAILAGMLGLIAAGTLAHVLVTAVRRRRRDLAILKTIGFVRRQARVAVVWQATVTTLVAAAIGLPAGIVAGRWLWTVFMGRIGLAAEPVLPVLVLALVVPGALLLANLIAALPARAAARTKPAIVLRTE